MSQFTNCRYVVLTSLCPPPRGPNTFFYNGEDIYISNSFIYLGKDSDCWKMKLLPSVHPSLELPFPILSTCFGDNFGGDTESPVGLCAEEQSSDTGTHFGTGPQMWYTRILLLEILFSTYVASQKFFWNFPGASASCSWTTGTGKNTPRAM